MDASEVSASIAQVDSMLDRVVKVIGRDRPEKPLRPDVSYPRKPKPLPKVKPPINFVPTPQQHSGYSQAISSGSLAGNEMRVPSGYSPRPQQRDDCDPDGMWANFESEFDDMVAGMR